jgi:hypothetical protein
VNNPSLKHSVVRGRYKPITLLMVFLASCCDGDQTIFFSNQNKLCKDIHLTPMEKECMWKFRERKAQRIPK